MNRGINFKLTKGLLINLIDGKTEGFTRSEYKQKIIELFCKDLESNYLYVHFYTDLIEIDYHNTGCIAKIKAGYYPTMSSDIQYKTITFLSDCVLLDGLYINY